jgi:Kef-type K+ transport system membrane component KefB
MAEAARAPAGRGRTLVGYAVMLAATVGAYFFVRSVGEGLAAPAPDGPSRFGVVAGLASADTLLHVLLALVVVIILARALGTLFRRLDQPPVIGEIIAGIVLGPSLLGRVAPEVSAYVLPHSVGPYLGVISQVGVILYMFLVGLELDPSLLRKRGHATIAISHASIIAPFVLGAALALWLYPLFSTSDVPFTCFSLFLGVSMSVTAFPVLARILTDRRMHTSRMGTIALTCAAVDDVTAWCLLAFVVSVVQARAAGALVTAGLAVGFIAIMAFIVRPAMVRLARVYGNRGRMTQGVMALVFVALLSAAAGTEVIGIHAVFGAFALGAVIPHDSSLARELTDRLEDIVVVLLLPAFFAFTGMRTEIGLLGTATEWLVCGVIILVASAGKFGGSLVAARLTGLGWRDSAALGVLMNTRGLMELIVLNIGLELGVISPTLFAMLVLMAVLTTFATTPVLQLIQRGRAADEDGDVAAPALPLPAARGGGGLIVPVSNPVDVQALMELAAGATRPCDPPPRVVGMVRRPPGGVRSGLRELDDKAAPESPALAAALEHARRVGLAIDPVTLWTDDPAADILRLGHEPSLGWVLLGFHRPVFGSDLFGGVVREVVARAPAESLHVGVVIHGHQRPLDRLVIVADDSDDGAAALELGARYAATRAGQTHVVLVPPPGASEVPAEVLGRVRAVGKESGRWLHTDLLGQRTPAELAQKTRADLVVMGYGLADELGLPLDDIAGQERCVLVVRGARPRPPRPLAGAASGSLPAIAVSPR